MWGRTLLHTDTDKEQPLHESCQSWGGCSPTASHSTGWDLKSWGWLLSAQSYSSGWNQFSEFTQLYENGSVNRDELSCLRGKPLSLDDFLIMRCIRDLPPAFAAAVNLTVNPNMGEEEAYNTIIDKPFGMPVLWLDKGTTPTVWELSVCKVEHWGVVTCVWRH